MNELAKLLREAAGEIRVFHGDRSAFADRLSAAAASLDAQEPAQRKWSALLVGTDTGLIGSAGTTWEGHPDHYERVTLSEFRHPPTSAVLEWIPVWERMPEELKYTHVLITLDNGDRRWVAADRYDGYSKSWENHYDPSGTVSVTHWMPLPAPAQQQGGD